MNSREYSKFNKNLDNYYYMKLLSKLELVGFYWCENNVCSEIEPSELFLRTYEPIVPVVENNISQERKLKSTTESPVFLSVDKEKYEKHAREIFNKLIARFRYENIILIFRIRPRMDSKIFVSPLEGQYLRKYPAALFAIHENTSSILVIREARFYREKYHRGEFVLREPDFDKISKYALIEEPFVLSLREVVNLDVKVFTEFYRSPLRFVESAFLYGRPFYPLFVSQERDLDEEVRQSILKRFLLKELRYAVVIGDFNTDQFAIGTIDDKLADVVITDPEMAYIPNPKKLKKVLGILYKQISRVNATKLFFEIWRGRREVGKDASYTFEMLKNVMQAYKKGKYKEYLDAIYSGNGTREEAH